MDPSQAQPTHSPDRRGGADDVITSRDRIPAGQPATLHHPQHAVRDELAVALEDKDLPWHNIRRWLDDDGVTGADPRAHAAPAHLHLKLARDPKRLTRELCVDLDHASTSCPAARAVASALMLRAPPAATNLDRVYLRTPIAMAHRGGAKVWPENTVTAFEGAIALGFRYIETDLHVTADGHIVCFHDATLSRTTDGVGRLKDLTLAELRTLDPGFRFTRDGRTFPFRGRGCQIPTLEQAFALHPELMLNVEMKQRDPAMEARLWQEIDRLRVHDRILVAAEHDKLVHRFRALRARELPTSPGKRGVAQFLLSVRAGLSRFQRPPFAALQVPPTYAGVTVVDRAFVEAAHARSIHVHCWTIDDPAEMHRLLDLKVDGVMTDRPEVLRDVFVERGLPLAPDAD